MATKTQDWGLTVTNHNQGGWGATAGKKFNPPLSVKKRFITSAPGATPITWDEDAAYEELATTYIELVKNIYPILRHVDLVAKDIKGNYIFSDESQNSIVNAIRNAIQFASENKNVWERVTGYSVSTPNFTMQNETTGWIFSSSAWGHIAWAMLQNSEMNKYELCENGDIRYNGLKPNTILANVWMSNQDLLDKILADMKANPTLFKGDKGDPGADGAGITPSVQQKIDNLPADTNAALSGKQDDLKMFMIDTAGQEKIASTYPLTSDDASGKRHVPTRDKDLTDKEYVDKSIEDLETYVIAKDTLYENELGLIAQDGIINVNTDFTHPTATTMRIDLSARGLITNEEYEPFIKNKNNNNLITLYNDSAKTQVATFTFTDGATGTWTHGNTGIRYKWTINGNVLELEALDPLGGVTLDWILERLEGKAQGATLKERVNNLEKKGSYKGTFYNIADINAIQSPNVGDYAVLKDSTDPTDTTYQEYIYDGAMWEPIGSAATTHPQSIDAYTKTETDNLLDGKVGNQGIKYYKGQILEFNEVKTGTKFEDATLFDKHLIADGQAIVGGTDGSTTNGSADISYSLTTTKVNGSNFGEASASNGTNTAQRYSGSDSGNNIQTQIKVQKPTNVLAKGIKLLKVVYIAKKDITYGEMV